MALHNVFVSHRHEDDSLIEDLKTMLRAAGSEVRDSSVDTSSPNKANNEEYIKSILRDRIEWAGKMVVIVSPQTKDHEWVDWEIEYASGSEDKRIIGVWAPGAEGCDVPEALELHADSIVGWDGQKIADALNGADNWEQPDGAPAEPRHVRKAPC